jgi:hypothetical protein
MGKGKGLKTVLTIGAFFLGAGGWNPFGIAGASGGLMGGLMGASLVNSIWAATHKPDMSYDTSSRFDQMMNTISSESMIPVIYGERKWAGPQLWHKASADGMSLTKDVLVGEGEIEGISDLKANDVGMIKTTETKVLLSIKNTKDPKATIMIALELRRNKSWGTIFNYNTPQEITITHRNLTIQQLLDKINAYSGSGWVATSEYPKGNASEIPGRTAVPCYNSAVTLNKTITTQEGLPGCSYDFHNGASTQAPPDNFDEVGGYRKMAWVRTNMTISSSLQGNNPTITYVAKGIKVLDTRTNVTAWSDNPAMCVRDYLLSKRYGISKFVPNMILDEQSFKEVADYCDELVWYRDKDGVLKQEKRYRLNIILDQRRKAMDHLDSIFAVFGGFLVNNNGVIALRIEKPETSSYHFTNDTIVENSVIVEQLSSDENPNQYKIGYFDTTQNWTQVKALVNDIIDQQPSPIGKGKVVTKELTLDGCTSQSQALRLGRLYKLKNKLCSLTISFKTSTFAMHLQCGDIVTMTYDKVVDGELVHAFVDMPWRIIEISEQDGIWSIKARQYNASIYGDVTEAIQVKDYVPIANPLSSIVPDVVNLDITENYRELGNGMITSDARVTWTSIDPFYKEAEVYVLSDNPTWFEIETSLNDLEGTWESIGNNSGSWKLVGKGTNELFMTNLVKGLTYTFKVVSVNSVNRKATFDTAPEVSILIKSKTYTPSTPRGLQVSITDKCEWYWNALDLDCDYAELRMNDDTGNITGLLAKTSSTRAIATPPSRHGVAYLYAHNTSGLYSYPCVFEYRKEAPSAPAKVTLTDVFQGVVVTTEALPLYCVGINVHINDGTGDKVFYSPNNSYTFKTTGGIFDIQVAFVDIFGEGAKSAVVTKVVSATVDPALLAAESLSLEKMDAVIKDAVEKAKVSIDTTTFNSNVSRLEAEKTSKAEFTNTVNQLVQVDNNNASAIQQTATTINSTIASNKSDAETKINKVASDLTQTSQSLTSTIQSNKTDIEGKLATTTTQIKQTTDGITTTVQNNKTAQDTVNTTVGSRIDQQATQITSVVVGLNNANTAIAQTDAAVQLRAKSAELISLINACPEAITILSRLIHISGDTLFDDNVIVSKMLSALCVTADKIAVGAVSADKISATLAEIKGKLTASQIDAGVISADKITTGTLSADLIYQAGYQVRSVVMQRGTIAHGSTIPLPAGYTKDQCVYGVQWMDPRWPWYPDPNLVYWPESEELSVNINRVVICQCFKMYHGDSGSLGNRYYGNAHYWIMGVK